MRKILTASLGALLLGACGQSPEPPPQPTNVVQDEKPKPAPEAPAAPVNLPAKAQPVALQEKSAEIEFDYRIPAEAAAIPQLLRALRSDASARKTRAIADQRAYARDLPPDAEPHPFGVDIRWEVIGQTTQLLVLVAKGYVYTGGAHGSDTFETLIWDRAGERRLAFDDLFTDSRAAQSTIRAAFCSELLKARRVRTGVASLDPYGCPEFLTEAPLAPMGLAGGKFARIGVFVPADVAGAHAEGSYEIKTFIPKSMIPLVRPDWRASFPGGAA